MSVLRFAAVAVSMTSVLGMATPCAAQKSFDDFGWTLVGTPGGASTVDSTTMHVVGPSNGSCVNETTYFETTAPLAGTVTVVVDWDIFDICHYDWPIWVVDGTYTQFDAGEDCWLSGSTYSATFAVPAGATFGFGVGSSDCFEGPGVADFSAFTFEETFWVDQGGALDPRLAQTFAAPMHSSDLGLGVGAPGDLDGDGVDDVVLGLSGDATVEARSGSTGALLWSRTRSGLYGRSIASPGDIDGDDVPDVAVGNPTGEKVHLESGADGHTLWTRTFTGTQLTSWAMAALGDVDGDGLGDLVVGGLFGPSPGATVRVLSGVDGSDVWVIPPGLGDFGFGEAVANAGDVDGDGVDDILVGAPSFPSRARVFSGATSNLLYLLEPPAPMSVSAFGAAVAGAGDVDGDGHADLLVGAPILGTGDDYHAGAVMLFSGLDGSLAKTFLGSGIESRFGSSLLGNLDINDDGSIEMAVGERLPQLDGQLDVGRITIRRAVGGQLFTQLDGTTSGGQFGSRMAASVSSTGQTSLVVGAPFDNAGGSATLWRQLLHPGAPSLAGGGEPVPGQAWTLAVTNGRPLASSVFVFGGSQLGLPFKGGVLVPSPDVLVYVPLDGAGELTLGGTWPALIPTSIPIWIQTWVSDPAGPVGWTATNGLQTIP